MFALSYSLHRRLEPYWAHCFVKQNCGKYSMDEGRPKLKLLSNPENIFMLWNHRREFSDKYKPYEHKRVERICFKRDRNITELVNALLKKIEYKFDIYAETICPVCFNWMGSPFTDADNIECRLHGVDHSEPLSKKIERLGNDSIFVRIDPLDGNICLVKWEKSGIHGDVLVFSPPQLWGCIAYFLIKLGVY
jgi:hypothetical protein